MAFSQIVRFMFVLVISASLAFASEPSPLQDFCVADNTSPVFVNGVACKNPSLVTANDFTFSGLNIPGNTSNKQGFAVNLVTVDRFPGLNTFGVTVERLDFAPKGLNSPHSHPRATEVLTVIKGSLYVGFISTDNKLFSKVMNKGDVFVFPIGLVHFQYNVGDCDVEAFSVLSSQDPGVVRIADSLFGANPAISDDILSKAFMLDKKTVDYIQSQF
ncbi:RmlC-like cupins superfamily protein [Rhynchospora pubera]|uniref:Germin-like protein n=1 Tax=Rhynchospora pubera TaxID=906938 RepID=A0AAV8HJ03_9POAL|nr:RmlC-like cupins superfamily protein [Rhynchospora pubera]